MWACTDSRRRMSYSTSKEEGSFPVITEIRSSVMAFSSRRWRAWVARSISGTWISQYCRPLVTVAWYVFIASTTAAAQYFTLNRGAGFEPRPLGLNHRRRPAELESTLAGHADMRQPAWPRYTIRIYIPYILISWMTGRLSGTDPTESI